MVKKLFLFVFFVLLGFVIIFGYAHYIEPNMLTVKSITVETDKEIKPCKVVFFADTHFGKYYKETHLEKIVDRINKMNADLVIFGGDLIDNYARDRDEMDLEYIEKLLGKIETKAGKYAVWGNHDYGGGTVRFYEELMTESGFRILKNDSKVLEEYGIQLIGYDDNLMGWTDPSLYTIKSNLFNIIAAHEPVVFKYIQNDSDNFLLSGHTHGGQVTIPVLTDKLLPKGSGGFVKGYYTDHEIDNKAKLDMYVSSGVGVTRYPLRFMNIPEIVEVTFVASK